MEKLVFACEGTLEAEEKEVYVDEFVCERERGGERVRKRERERERERASERAREREREREREKKKKNYHQVPSRVGVDRRGIHYAG